MKAKTLPSESRISSRIDPKLKKQATTVLKKLGIRQSQAIAMFYSQIVANKGLPFDVKMPNDDTKAAMNELKNDKCHSKHASVKDLMEDLKS